MYALNSLYDRFLEIYYQLWPLEREQSHNPLRNRIVMIQMRQHFVAEIVDHIFYHERLALVILHGILMVLLMLSPHHHRTLTVPLTTNHSIDDDDAGDDDLNAMWVMKVYHPMMHCSCLLHFKKQNKFK